MFTVVSNPANNMKTISFVSMVLMISAAFAGCLHDDSVTPTNNNSDSGCWEILQISTVETNAWGGGEDSRQMYTNLTYDSDCRVIISESMGKTYLNTTYDTDGNIATLETAISDDPFDNPPWHYSTTTHSYIGGLLMQTATEGGSDDGMYTNFTYDSDDRVIVSETMGRAYLNTTYDTDGNIATLVTTFTHDQGATWIHSTTTNLWGEP